MIPLLLLFLIVFIAIIISSNVYNNRRSQIIDGENKPPIPAFSKILEENVTKDKPKKKRDILQYFCTSDNGYITVWPKDQLIPDYLDFNIAGTNYRKGLMKYTGEFKGRLEEKPTNEYDPKAIKVLAEDGHHVGYVPKDMTDRIREFMPLPCTCYCYLHRRREDGKYIYFGSAYITTTPPEE